MFYLLVKIIKRVRVLMGDSNVHFLAHCYNVLVSHPSEGFGVLLECEVSCLPFFKKSWQNIGRLAADHKQPTVEFSQTGVKILQGLK